MENRYKITLSNNNLYKEIELTQDVQQVKVGTGVDCDIRLRKDLFFGQIELLFSKKNGEWSLRCSDNLYLTVGDIRKLMTKRLVHGDTLEVKYQDSDNLVFTLDYLIDFDDGTKKYERIVDISKVTSLTVGTSADCNISIGGAYVKNDRLVLSKKGDKLALNIQNTTYGVYINGRRAAVKDVIKNGDFLSVSDYLFYFKDNKIWTQIRPDLTVNALPYSDQPIPALYPKFNRNTRIKTVVCDEKIEILDPPAKPQKPKNNIVTRLLPSLGMLLAAGVMAYFGGAMIIMSAISGTMAIITTILSIREGKKDYKTGVAQRLEKYTSYIAKKREEIQQARDQEHRELEDLFISMPEEEQRFAAFSSDLFDRSSDDEDFLCVRLGSGDVPSKREINYKKQEKLEIEDELQQIPEQICLEYKNVHNAPIVCDFKEINAFGIIGHPDNRFEFLKNIVIDIAARQYFADVKFVFVAEKENKERIQWLRFLPHVYNDTVGIRNIVCDDESKSLIFEYLYKELTAREQSKTHKENIVVFFLDEYGFKSHPISKFVDNAKDLGVTFVFFGDTGADVPQGCGYIVSIADEKNAVLINTQNRNDTSNFVYPSIDLAKAKEIVQLLAPIYTEEISLEGALTKNVSMFELLNILAVDDIDLERRWKTSQIFKSMAAPIGISKTGVVSLDLHDKAHGPHGLVAGTTGSGKSEILQTYILSMATLYHPYEVGFVIIDFKGGGMVNQFKDLPHLLGAITNIDGKEINRSLKSIKAELQKRQRLFAEAEVNHIDKYIKKYKAREVEIPLPHLILIVDEFAELKAEQPEFMKELISAARIGRSLGVHLILATQKPSGQVNEQIWSNSRFKLCLKVQTQEDSNEVLKSPLAAEIKEPGRAYLQVGNNEIFELFQSAYSGAPENQGENTTHEFMIYSLESNGKRLPIFAQKREKNDTNTTSQLEAIVRYVHAYCESVRVKHLANICLPPLPERIPFANEGRTQGIAIGMFDDPDCQKQESAILDIESRNTIIIGSPQCGKTNLLQSVIRTIAENSAAEDANIYIIDFASMMLKSFEELKHVGGVVTSSDDEKLKNLFKLLHGEIAARKEKLLAAGVSSFSAYKDAGYKDLPQIYLIIDNLTALIELYLQDSDTLLVLVREGLAVGISTIVANAQTVGVGYRYLSNFSNRIALHCNDTNEYANLFDHANLQPSEVPGRCVLSIEKKLLECQTYLAFEGEREVDRIKAVRSFVDKINSDNRGKGARKIPTIPAILNSSILKEMFGISQVGYELPVGVTYSDVETFCIDIAQIGVFGICGSAEKYQHGFVRYIVQALASQHTRYPAEVHIIDDVNRQFASLKDTSIVKNYTLDASSVLTVLPEWHKRLEARYQKMLESPEKTGADPLLVLVIQNNDVAKCISKDFNVMNLYNEITTRYKSMGICIIYANYENVSLSYDAPEPLRQIKQDRHIFFYDDLDALKPFDPPYEAIRENRKKLNSGDAYYIRGNDVTKLKMVEPTDKPNFR